MSRVLRRIRTYLTNTLALLLLSALVLYYIGQPVRELFLAEANMMITQGAPGDDGAVASNLPNLVTTSTKDQSEIQVPELDTQYGRISCDRIELSAPLYYGDSDAVLNNGVGQYPNKVLPGQGKTMLLSGHDVTYFAPLEAIKIGDIVKISTDYGEYSYSVVSKQIADKTDTTAYNLEQEKEQLILYTCYPFGQLAGDRNQRFFVYCERMLTAK